MAGQELEDPRPGEPSSTRERDPYLSSFSLSSISKGPDLRIGLLVRGSHLTRASISVLDDIEASSFARIEMILLSPVPAQGRRPNPIRFVQALRSMGEAFSSALWQVYLGLDRRRVRLPDDPLSVLDVSSRLRAIPLVRVSRPGPDGVDDPTDHACASIRAAGLDVIIHLGGSDEIDADPRHELGLDRTISDLAAYGTWAFRFGDAASERSGPAYLNEIVAEEAVCTVSLERLPDSRGGGLTLATAAFPTDVGSVTRNRVQPLYGSTHLVIQKLREVHDDGWERVARAAVAWRQAPGPHQRHHPPSAVKLARWMAPRLVRKVALRLVMSITGSGPGWQWRTAIRAGDGGGPEQRLGDMAGFRWLESPPGRSYADPFLMRRNDRTWLFFEDQASPRDAGCISCVEVAADGRVGPPVVVVQSAGHVSYPYVFSDGDAAYMIPETSAENAVRLYRATDFPHGWTMVKELYRGRALDTSAWRHEGRWWFWTTLREPRSGALGLMLFHADALDGPWTSHPQNPISIDVRNARSAGSIFSEGNRIFRPSQDCSRTYGYGFTLYEIVTLSTTEYKERPVIKVGPDWHPGLYGTHTYNRSGGIEATDGKFKVTRRLRG
jgi:hypothetical protein